VEMRVVDLYFLRMGKLRWGKEGRGGQIFALGENSGEIRGNRVPLLFRAQVASAIAVDAILRKRANCADIDTVLRLNKCAEREACMSNPEGDKCEMMFVL